MDASRRNGVIVTAWIFFAGVLLFSASLILIVERKLARLVLGGLGESFSTRIYGAPFPLTPEARVAADEIMTRLDRLNYKRTNEKPSAAGAYFWSAPVLSIHFRGFRSPLWDQPETLVRLVQGRDFSWTIKDAEGEAVPLVALEPELVAELSGPQKVRRDPATWEDLPPALVNAVVAVEDKRFFRHPGVDLHALGRAAWRNVREARWAEGGSTLTQQLAKNFFFRPQKTISRKIYEMLIAVYMTVRFSKERIITMYLNHIYLGQDGYVSINGVKAAARHYFDKDVKDLTLSECAVIAGMIRSPMRLNPFQHPTAARRRRNTVLKLMKEQGLVSDEDFRQALSSNIVVAEKRRPPENDALYFVSEIIRQLLPDYREDELYRSGLRIHTTIDPLFQKYAQDIIHSIKRQGALVAIDPANGHVLALVGGRDYAKSQFNRATQARRQPGSAFKPFVFGAALEKDITPATMLHDEPRAYSSGGQGVWAPQNFDAVYHGTVTVREAFKMSMNAATLYLAEQVGSFNIVRFARKMGISSPLPYDLSLALGTAEVTPLELTAAYAPFANGGFRITPMFVNAVMDAEGEALDIRTPTRESVMDPAVAYLMTSLLESVVTEGTAKSLSSLGWTYPAAGKTGTTNSGKDAWFIGYTPGLLAGVWTGEDDARAAYLSGSKNALPLWARFMNEVYKTRPTQDFVQPLGLNTTRIDPISGLLARSGCTNQREEVFIIGTEPKSYCPLHAGGFKGFLHRLFGS